MRLALKRKILTAESTIGQLDIDGAYECVTLEDPVRPEKIKGVTAIPAGTYNVDISYSNKFKRDMPRLENVPDFEGILIHWGNTAKDTEGCILVGESTAKNFIGSSRIAFDKVFAALNEASKRGEKISIKIS